MAERGPTHEGIFLTVFTVLNINLKVVQMDFRIYRPLMF